MNLLEKRAKIAEEHKAMARHDPHWKSEAKSGHCISKRPVAFKCDDEIVVIGDDVAVIVEAVRAFQAKVDAAVITVKDEDGKTRQANAFEEEAKNNGQLAFTLSRVKRFLAKPPTDEIRVGTQVWNALLHGIQLAHSDTEGHCSFHVVMTEGLVE